MRHVQKNTEMKSRERFYLHGDLIEGTNNQYFCDFCDLAVSALHFHDEHPDKNNFERFQRNLKKWKKMKALGTKFKRPNDVANCFW